RLHRARERHAPEPDRPPAARGHPGARDRAARAGRAPGAARAPAGAALRGRAAARGGGARPRPAPEAPPRRRADRQPGPGHRRGRPAAHVRAQPGARRGARGRDPQRPPGGGDGADAPPGGRRAPRAGLRAAGTRPRHDVVRRLAMARHARRRTACRRRRGAAAATPAGPARARGRRGDASTDRARVDRGSGAPAAPRRRLPENRVEVVFRVKERPLVRAVKIEGNKKVKREELEGALKIRAHTILDPEKARQGLEAGKKLYVEKGYLDAELTYSTEPVGEN